jgi:hypothetical protein
MRTEFRRQRAEDRGLRTEDRGQKTAFSNVNLSSVICLLKYDTGNPYKSETCNEFSAALMKVRL